jgi:hypothetical protein
MTCGTAICARCRIPMISPRHCRAGGFAAWQPFLTGVAPGLALLAVIGAAFAQRVDHGPFDTLLKAHVRNGTVDCAGFEGNPAGLATSSAMPTASNGSTTTGS